MNAIARRHRPGIVSLRVGSRREETSGIGRAERQGQPAADKHHRGQITSNTRRAHEATHLMIEVTSAPGQQSGLLNDSVVSCVNLATIHEARIDRWIGSLPSAVMVQVDECLKAALGLP